MLCQFLIFEPLERELLHSSSQRMDESISMTFIYDSTLTTESALNDISPWGSGVLSLSTMIFTWNFFNELGLRRLTSMTVWLMRNGPSGCSSSSWPSDKLPS